MYLRFLGPRKIRTAWWGGGLSICLHNRRFHRPSWSKIHFKKLGFGLGEDLTIIVVQT
jgi:hypothetical protein